MPVVEFLPQMRVILKQSITFQQSSPSFMSALQRARPNRGIHKAAVAMWKNNLRCITYTARQLLRFNFVQNWREQCWTPRQLKTEDPSKHDIHDFLDETLYPLMVSLLILLFFFFFTPPSNLKLICIDTCDSLFAHGEKKQRTFLLETRFSLLYFCFLSCYGPHGTQDLKNHRHIAWSSSVTIDWCSQRSCIWIKD